MARSFKGLLLVTVALPAVANASTIAIDLSGNPADIQTGLGSGIMLQNLNLIDAATGGDIPAFSFAVGDIISGTVQFSTPFTLPASQGNFFYVLNLGYTDANIGTSETFTYSLGGATVSAPASYMNFSGSTGFVAPGQYTNVSTPPLSFDKISYTYTINSIADGSGSTVGSGMTSTTTPSLFVLTNSAVPEPASWAFAIMGLGAAGMVKRRRAAQQRRIACGG